MGSSSARGRFARLAAIAALVMSMALLAVPAQGGGGWPQSINGRAWDNAGGVKGLLVEIASTDGTFIVDTLTDASGNYSAQVPVGTYTAKFTDPHPNPNQVYATRWYDFGTSGKTATHIDVLASINTTADEFMSKAVRFDTVVRRSGHLLTTLPGINVVVTHRDSSNVLDTYSGVTGADGSFSVGGLPYGDFVIEALDPTGTYQTTWLQSTWLTIGSNSAVYREGYLPLGIAGMDLSVSRPSSKSTVKKNKAFTSSGKLGKRVSSPTKMKIVAWRKVSGIYRPWKTFSAKITKRSTYSVYSGKVKLPAGKYRLYGLFPGSGTWAAANSTTYTSVTSK